MPVRRAHTRTDPRTGRPVRVAEHTVRGQARTGAVVDDGQQARLRDQAMDAGVVDRAGQVTAAIDVAANAEAALARVRWEAREAEAARERHEAAMGPVRGVVRDANQKFRDAHQTHQRALAAIKGRISRLYVDHGVPEGLAPLLAEDTMNQTAARSGHPYPVEGEDRVWTAPGELKTKRRGPHREATRAAAQAAQQDAELARLAQELETSLKAVLKAVPAVQSAYRRCDETEADHPASTVSPAAYEARIATADAAAHEARWIRNRLLAAQWDDLPGQDLPAGQVRLGQVVRRADGSLNIAVWEQETDDLTEGRWVPVSDVQAGPLGGVMVTEDGTTVSERRRIPTQPGLASTEPASWQPRGIRVLLDTDATGEPVVDQKYASEGFVIEIDSTG